MPLCFKYNDTTYELPAFTSNVAPVCLHVVKNGTTYYVPTDVGLSNIIVDNYKYFYNSSKPTIHIVSGGGSLGNCFNDSEQAITYDIPAGTYTPSAFESLVSTFVGYNSSRKVQYAYQVAVNNQIVQCAANTYIALQNCYNSPYAAKPHAVWFNRQSTSDLTYTPPAFYLNSNTGFTNGKCYVTFFNTSSADRYSEQSYNNYANYPITVTTGIKFA